MSKITKNDVEALVTEMGEIEGWLNPKPNPDVWPPVGWQEHPMQPGYYYRVIPEEDLREEIFGSERKTEWLQSARNRVQEIKTALITYFFPKAEEEGVQRKSKNGYTVMLKTGLKRELDVAALASIITQCQKLAKEMKLSLNVENNILKWTPGLKLKEYRELPQPIREKFDAALIITPTQPVFEIVQEEQE